MEEIISKSELEKILGEKIVNYKITPGSNHGDNYMSVLHSIEVNFSDKNDTKFLLLKSYPTHPARQEHLNQMNIFWLELKVYSDLIPKLQIFADENGLGKKLPFAPFVNGKGYDFSKLKEDGDSTYDCKNFGPLDIYILMVDLRKTFNFRMANRLNGLDFAHISLVIKEHASYHALSWAYKAKNKLSSFLDHFPFLEYKVEQKQMDEFVAICQSGADKAAELIKKYKGEKSPLYDSVIRSKGFLAEMVNSFAECFAGNAYLKDMRVTKPEFHNENEEPWKVIVHGDCWVNNLLFHYDETTKMPNEAVLVDLQLMREGCPMMEMNYLIYSSTDANFRKNHMDNVHQIYYTEFVANCAKLGVAPPLTFTLDEIKRKFHCGKIFGYAMSLVALPLILNEANIDLETLPADLSLVDMFQGGEGGANSRLTIRMIELVEELYEEGVI